MRRVIRGLPRRQVASRVPAIRRLNRQRVIAVDVALHTACYLAGRSQLVRIC